MPAANLAAVLARSARQYGRRTAIVFGRKRITYAALDTLTDEIASGLLQQGIGKGERVALFLDNCPEFVIAYYAILKAGMVVVPVNYLFKIEEAKYIIEDSGAAALITSRAYAEMAEELRVRVDALKIVITTSRVREEIPHFETLRHAARALAHVRISPDDTAVILYTSGTTGNPKGAVLTHRNLVSNALDSSKVISVTRRDTFLCILPLFHSFAATVCMNLPMAVGAATVIMKSVRPFKRVIRAIRRNRVSVFVGVPSLYSILKEMKLPRIFRSPLIKLFNPVRLCISGAAALPVDTLLGFERTFRIPLLEGYGLTEASPVVTLNPLKGVRKPGSIGLPLAGHIAVRVVDEQGRPLRTEAIGELAVNGPNVMREYYRKQEATAETIRDGWLFTGDMARIDADGYVYIVGRKKEMVNVRGLNVYPREIEEVLYRHPAVKEAAVIGVADEHKGEVPKGFVVLKEGCSASEHELIRYLREHLASFKIPKHIEFRMNLPKNTTGKVLKRLLKSEDDRSNPAPS